MAAFFSLIALSNSAVPVSPWPSLYSASNFSAVIMSFFPKAFLYRFFQRGTVVVVLLVVVIGTVVVVLLVVVVGTVVVVLLVVVVDTVVVVVVVGIVVVS